MRVLSVHDTHDAWSLGIIFSYCYVDALTSPTPSNQVSVCLSVSCFVFRDFLIQSCLEALQAHLILKKGCVSMFAKQKLGLWWYCII